MCKYLVPREMEGVYKLIIICLENIASILTCRYYPSIPYQVFVCQVLVTVYKPSLDNCLR